MKRINTYQNRAALITAVLLTLFYCSNGQSKRDSVIVGRADLIRAVEKLEYCDSVLITNSALRTKLSEADHTISAASEVITSLGALVTAKENTNQSLEAIKQLQANELSNLSEQLKKERRKATGAKWGIGAGCFGGGALVGILVGLFAVK